MMSRYLLVLGCLFLLESASLAQTVTGSISGLITDSSGAAVPDVVVTVTDIDRSVTFKGNSNESGFYLVSPVPPGRYRVEAERTGFRRHVIESFPIATQQKAGLDIRLDVGNSRVRHLMAVDLLGEQFELRLVLTELVKAVAPKAVVARQRLTAFRGQLHWLET